MTRDRRTEKGRRRFGWIALVGLGLVGVVAVSAATAFAARSSASPFELVFTGRYAPWPECEVEPDNPFCFDMQPGVGTFTSGAPFCESGTTEAPRPVFPRGMERRYTCADGSGSVTLEISDPEAEFTPSGSGEWAIVEGSGRYEDLRGKGTYSGELLSGSPADLGRPIVFRTTARGFADADTAPPSVSITSATVTELRRHPGEYVLRVVFAARDDVEGNPVAYKLIVTQWGHAIADTEGTTASGSVSATLRVLSFRGPPRRIRLHLRAWDPVGNEQLLVQSLKLPRQRGDPLERHATTATS